MPLKDADLPVLKDIVQIGDKSVIRSARSGKNTIELSMLAPSIEPDVPVNPQAQAPASNCAAYLPCSLYDDSRANDGGQNDAVLEEILDTLIGNTLEEQIDLLRVHLHEQLKKELLEWIRSGHQ